MERRKQYLSLIVIITSGYLICSCFDKKEGYCPNGMPAYLVSYIDSNYREGDTIVYENQTGKQIRIPVQYHTYKSAYYKVTDECDIDFYLLASYKDSVWLDLRVTEDPVKYWNLYSYRLVFGKYESSGDQQKVMPVNYGELGPNRRADVYTELGINNDSVALVKDFWVGDVKYPKLYRIVPDSTGLSRKPAVIQYFYHRERGIVRFDERGTGQIWIRKQ